MMITIDFFNDETDFLVICFFYSKHHKLFIDNSIYLMSKRKSNFYIIYLVLNGHNRLIRHLNKSNIFNPQV